jgi:hypothetical protein
MQVRSIAFGVGIIVLMSLTISSLKAQDWLKPFVNSVYEQDWQKSTHITKQEISNNQVALVAEAFVWRWKYLPIQHHEKFDEYIALLEKATVKDKNSATNSKESEYWTALANLYKAEAYYNADDQFKAFSTGKKMLDYLESLKIDEKNLSEKWLLKGIYLYYLAHAVEKFPFFGGMLNWWYKGDKERGLSLIRQVALSDNFANIEAKIYYVHILTKLELKPEKALPVAASLYSKYPENPKLTEMYIENLLLCGQLEKAKKINDVFAKIDIPYYRLKYYYYDGYLNEKLNQLPAAEKSYQKALKEMDLAPGEQAHIRSLVHAGLYRIAKMNAQTDEAKKHKLIAEKHKVYDYQLFQMD